MKTMAPAMMTLFMFMANGATGQTATGAPQTAPAQNPQTISIARSESLQANKGSAQYFTGTVQIQQLFVAHDPSRTSGGRVTFEPGARSAWHTLPFGQEIASRVYHRHPFHTRWPRCGHDLPASNSSSCANCSGRPSAEPARASSRAAFVG